MKLVLRSGGRIENRDPFKRSPSGFQMQSLPDTAQDRFKAKEMMTLHAVARTLSKVSRSFRPSDSD